MKKKNVVAVIVTYNPCVVSLKRLINAISSQVNHIAIIDNASINDNEISKCFSSLDEVKLSCLDENMGIAYAHNKGIECAQTLGADYVLILDQDSLPANNMVELLLSNIVENEGMDVVAIGPSYVDPRTKIRSYFMISTFGFPYRYKPQNECKPKKLVSVSFLISSGSLISMHALRQYGGMRSEYFIDHVDTEWCFRLTNAGKTLIGEHDAIMEHSLGDEIKRVWFGYMRNVAYHTPLRDYYMFRNTLLMLKDVKFTIIWKCFFWGRLVQFSFYFLIFTPNRIERSRYIVKGLVHGLKRISGRLDTKTFSCTDIPKTSFDPK